MAITIVSNPPIAPIGLSTLQLVITGAGGTTWKTTAPSFSTTGPAGTAATFTQGAVQSDTVCLGTLVTTGCAAGTATLTEAHSGATYSLKVYTPKLPKKWIPRRRSIR